MIVELYNSQNEIKTRNNEKVLLFPLRKIADNILRSMLLMFYSSLEKEGLCLKDFCVLHMGEQPSNKKFESLK